jgi:hypothetical protein
LLYQKLETEVIHGTRKQKEIHIKAKTEGIEDRERLQETWCQQQRGRAPSLGNREQIGQGWPEERRRRAREKTEQIEFPQGWKKRRPQIKSAANRLTEKTLH